MKNKFLVPLMAGVLALSFNSCQKDIKNINKENPNQFSDSDPTLMITGAQMANVLFNEGEAARLAGIFNGYFVGYDRQYVSYQDYNMTSGDFDNSWATLYSEGVAQCRLIRTKADAVNNKTLSAVASITEAHLLLTASSLWGDIPNTEACRDDIAKPKYDKMEDVHAYCIQLLDDAIPNVGGSGAYGNAYVAGFDWAEVANTLKARALMRKKDYAGALAAALNGVSQGKDLRAKHDQETPGAWNLYYDFCYWNRGGYMSCDGSHVSKLMDTASSINRNNAKTDEMPRFEWYFLSDPSEAYSPLDPNFYGIYYATTPYDLVTYVENELIIAECYARQSDNDKALDHLNNVRAEHDATYGSFKAYDIADFGPGKMVSGTSVSEALLMEILEEKYVSLFGQIETFSDIRRTKNALGIPVNTGSKLPARFLYPQSELTTNRDNVPTDQLDLFLDLDYFK